MSVMSAYLYLALSSVLGALAIPASAFLIARLGLCDPFTIEVFGRTIYFRPWRFLAVMPPGMYSSSTNRTAGTPQVALSLCTTTVVALYLTMQVPAEIQLADDSFTSPTTVFELVKI